MIYAGILVSMGILALLVSVSGLFVMYVDILDVREERKRREKRLSRVMAGQAVSVGTCDEIQGEFTLK
ncbi:MAG: hypothetical protein LUG61_07705 [Lachnospiraceae bacterium]|nr:hypothetical protein [Lachnospiraceae bacterium]